MTAYSAEMCLDLSTWLGWPAVFQISIGNSRVSVYGRIVDVVGEYARIRIGGSLDLDVPKDWIVGVQADDRFESQPGYPTEEGR